MITEFELFNESKYNYNFKKFEIVCRTTYPTNNPEDFYICIENSVDDLFIDVVRIGRKKQKKVYVNSFYPHDTWIYKYLFVYTPKINKMHQNILMKVDMTELDLMRENKFLESHPYKYLVDNYDYDFSKSENIIKMNIQSKKFKI